MIKLLGFFKKPAVKSVVNGIADSLPIISTIRYNIKATEAEGKTAEGKIDWIRLIANLICGGIILGVILGNISVEDAIKLIKAIFEALV